MIEKKQRVAAQRIYERFRQMGCEGKYTQGNEAVRELVRVKQDVFRPLIHRSGEAAPGQ